MTFYARKWSKITVLSQDIFFTDTHEKMTRTSNFQLLRGKRVFPASKTDTIA